MRLVASASVGAAEVAWSAAASTAAGAWSTASAAPTAVTASATIAAATSSSAAVATTGTFIAGSSFVDGELPIALAGVVQCVDRTLCFVVVFHFDEAETAGAARFAVGDDLSAGHFAILAKQFQEVVGGRAPSQISDVKILRHNKNQDLSVPKPMWCVKKSASRIWPSGEEAGQAS